MNWKISDLEHWDEKIKKIAIKYGLDWFPIDYEVCDYYEMMGHMSYHGMPTYYGHWSFGKSFERTHQFYNLGMTGLPYELIINSNPSIAYLMRENPLYLQVLIMAHCVGHSDFFKNNLEFKNTHPEDVIFRFNAAKKRIQSYVEDPTIGIEKVEKIIDACHAIQYQIDRNNKKRITNKEKREKLKGADRTKSGLLLFDINKIPVEPDYDIMGFMLEHGHHLDAWKKDIIEIVRDSSYYFMPQIKTKVLNEGWASFWHYKILNELDLPSEMHLPFLKSHNQVVCPISSKINPYHLGFHIFNKIEKEYGLEECFFVRENMNDVSAIRQFIDREDCEELNLFTYSHKKEEVSIDDVSDEDGWKKVKESLVMTTGVNNIPVIYVEELIDNNIIVMRHDHDGRDLELDYAEQVKNHISDIWGGEVKIFTEIENEKWEI